MAILVAVACLLFQEGEVAAARKHLEEAQKVFKDAPAVAFDEELVRLRGGDHKEDRSRSRCTVKRPNLLRLEIASKEKEGGHLVVLDGEDLWHFDRAKKEYAKYAQDESNTYLHFHQRLAVSVFLGATADNLRREGVKEIKIGREKIKDEECVVISWKEPNRIIVHVEVEESYRLYLDAKNYPRRAVRQWNSDGVQTTETTDYSNFDLSPKIDKDTFTFAPPAGAKKKEPPGPAR